ncbi:MAG: LLM class flavin-dependent oxidoreductase [bacterium]
MTHSNLRFGIFLAPFHPVDENPLQAMERDFQLVETLDRLGYDEAWIGEHHSAGYETIASPEIFIAAAAERTRHIRLGTGVVSLPYHHPLMVADRATQLDWQTRGRFMLGVGPGSLPTDAFMMGIDPLRQREMMEQSLAAIVPLLSGEAVTMKTGWFTLSEARVQFPPYTRPHLEMAVAAMISPAGPRSAGRHGLGMLSLGATTDAGYMGLANGLGHLRGGGRPPRPHRRPRKLAAGRAHAHRRNPGAGHRERALRPGKVDLLLQQRHCAALRGERRIRRAGKHPHR